MTELKVDMAALEKVKAEIAAKRETHERQSAERENPTRASDKVYTLTPELNPVTGGPGRKRV
jgi:hypothetical protein